MSYSKLNEDFERAVRIVCDSRREWPALQVRFDFFYLKQFVRKLAVLDNWGCKSFN